MKQSVKLWLALLLCAVLLGGAPMLAEELQVDVLAPAEEAAEAVGEPEIAPGTGDAADIGLAPVDAAEEKHSVSHRGEAMKKFAEKLKSLL